jgi:hypothetical protein
VQREIPPRASLETVPSKGETPIQGRVGSTAKPFTPIIATRRATPRLAIADSACPNACGLTHAPRVSSEIVELAYEICDWKAPESGALSAGLYEPYAVQSIAIEGAKPHPTTLVQSAAMASVAPPKPTYRPHLPKSIVESGLLSDAQLDSVIYAGEAHSGLLAGSFLVNESFDAVSAAPDDAEKAVRFRRGYYLGDGTGAGKGRQVAGVVLDNWLKGRRKALWISKSDKLLEDAQRDWAALGQEKLQIVPQSRFKQGAPIRLAEGILFTTYSTLRSH